MGDSADGAPCAAEAPFPVPTNLCSKGDQRAMAHLLPELRRTQPEHLPGLAHAPLAIAFGGQRTVQTRTILLRDPYLQGRSFPVLISLHKSPVIPMHQPRRHHSLVRRRRRQQQPVPSRAAPRPRRPAG
jgi:hypothetical protein